MTLFTMRFPCLKSISVSRAENLNWRAFPGFLVSHSATLEELRLAVTYESLFSCGQPWKPELLSSLRSFAGPTSSFRDMVDAGMTCLRSLKSLHFVDIDEFHRNVGPKLEHASGLLNQLRKWQATSLHTGKNPVLGLTELKLDLCYYNGDEERIDFCPKCYDSADSSDKCLFRQKPHKQIKVPPGCQGHFYVQEVLDVLSCFAQICGRTLEVWRGDINFPVDRDRLVAAFGQFERLRVVHVSQFTISTDPRGFALTLAANCSILEEVIIAYRDGVHFLSIRIVRDGTVPRIAGAVKEKFDFLDCN